jgi:glutaredoxin
MDGIVSNIKLIFFRGCPLGVPTAEILRYAGVEFDEIHQDQLSKDSPFQVYSSPTILLGDKVIFGSELTKGDSTGTSEKFDAEKIIQIITDKAS